MSHNLVRYRVSLRGVVQGIGLRPTLYQLASQFSLTGHCQNTNTEVKLFWQGAQSNLDNALIKLKAFLSQFGVPSITPNNVQPVPAETGFNIKSSAGSQMPVSTIAPDLATCSECLKEFSDKNNHRYLCPFISCAQCGPRFTISHTLPFDRHSTSMNIFSFCPYCQTEYDDPNNSRFHAQTISCPSCGPNLWLVDTNQVTLSKHDEAIKKTIDYLKQGKIVAIKGVGGFHLTALSTLDEPLRRLRDIKRRTHKPFALMVRDIEHANDYCQLTANEACALKSIQAPIVICQQNTCLPKCLSDLVAPKLNTLGLMLPYTALHHFILSELNVPLVVTSANLHADPIIYQNNVMLQQLDKLADYCLLHNRDIVNPLEDSIVVEIAKQIRTVRLARGLTPFTHPAPQTSQSFISLGGHLKNHIGLWHENKITLSQYFGDLTSLESITRFSTHFNNLIKVAPNAKMICDYHPDYASNQEAQVLDNKPIKVFHHIAHIFAVIEEHCIEAPVVGFAWDGFGLGENNKLCGCEVFSIDTLKTQQIACLAPIKMLGGEKAFKEPRRIALSLCEALLQNGLLKDIPPFVLSQFKKSEYFLLKRMFDKGLNTPVCASMGRLFDGVSALLGGPSIMSYEGQAALMLEHLAKHAANQDDSDPSYAVQYTKENQMITIDWQPMVYQLLHDLKEGQSKSNCAYRFHLWCMNIINVIAASEGKKNIVLSGGVFQNKLLTELCFESLTAQGYSVYLAQKVPTNDAGLAFGQIARIKYINRHKNKVAPCV